MSALAHLPVADDRLADDRRAVLAAYVDRALGVYAGQATISPRELATILGIGVTAAYALCRDGRVPTLRVGRSVRVLVPGVVAILLGVEP